MHRMIALTVALVAAAWCAPAAAQESTQPLDEAARLTFISAREAFVAGDYERALELFRQAYNLSQRPGLLYNIAQTLDRLRRDQETVDALQDYLRLSPDAQNRAEVEARIRVLENNIANNTPPPDPDPPPPDPNGNGNATGNDTPPPPPPEEDPLAILHPAVFIAVGGVALVAGGLSVWTGLSTLSLNDDYNDQTDVVEARRLYDEASTMQLLTNVFIISAAGLGAAAVVLAIITDWGAFDGDSESASADVRPIFSAGPDGGLIGLGGQF
ncbi:MAG: tol-pal system YbgF family protein [Sandaracinaceae bacterium]